MHNIEKCPKILQNSSEIYTARFVKYFERVSGQLPPSRIAPGFINWLLIAYLEFSEKL